jgi:hypothetical protein
MRTPPALLSCPQERSIVSLAGALTIVARPISRNDQCLAAVGNVCCFYFVDIPLDDAESHSRDAKELCGLACESPIQNLVTIWDFHGILV